MAVAVVVEGQLVRVRDVLVNLTLPQEETEGALQELADTLLDLARGSQNELRNLCFPLGIVKALFGILRSCRRTSQAGMVATSAQCLARLAHGNEEARSRLGEMGAVTHLLEILTPQPHTTTRPPPPPPPPHHSDQGAGPAKPCSIFDDTPRLPWTKVGGGLWPREWLAAYEQVLICLRKLTYHSDHNQQELARSGGIKLIIGMILDTPLSTSYGYFTPEAKKQLECLVLRKKLISRVVSVPDDEKKALLGAFPAVVTTHYPAFYVELVGEDQGWVSASMLERGLVWPDHASPTTPPQDSKWTCVMVQHVEDACHMWCQFCTQKPNEAVNRMKASLAELEPPSGDKVGVDRPMEGDVYAAFCAPPTSTCHAPRQWIRARVLSMLEELAAVRVLAVDFGFTTTVPCVALHPIPSPCRGVSPQAVPCKLRGILPLPASVSLLENAAAVIRNMSFELFSYRKEIKTFKGMEAMIKLAASPNRAVILQALGALLNLTVTETLKEEMGKKGAVQVAIKLVECSGEDGEVLEHAVGLLQSLGTFCPPNIALMAKHGGKEVLSGVKCDSERVDSQQRERIDEMLRRLLHYLRCHESKSAVSVSSSTSLHSDTLQPSSITSSSSSPPSSSAKKNLFQARRLANGERVQSKPVVRYSHHCHHHLPVSAGNISNSSSSLSAEEGCSAESAVDQRHSQGSTDCVVLHGSIFGRVKKRGGNVSRCVFYRVETIADFTTTSLKKAVCGALNTQEAWSIFLGVSSTGKVKGCKITQRERDCLCIGVDSLMRRFTPPVLDNCYNVTFLPVVTTHASRPGSVVPAVSDVFVVELTLQALHYNQIYTIKEKDSEGFHYDRCYYRKSTSEQTESLSFQELRDLVARKEAEARSEEVTKIMKDISELRG